jgi:MFS family permease
VGSAYLLPCAAFQPIYASLSDISGRKKVLFASLFLFLIGSIVGGVAQNMTTILAGRVIQGVGGGGLIPVSMIVLTDLVPLRQRPRYAAIIQVSIALGTILGPLIGGLFVEHTGHTGWRWVFYINFPLCTISGVMLFTSLKLQKGTAQLHSFDFVGAVLFISSLTSFLVAISWGGVQFAWDSYHTLVPLCFGVTGIIATGVWERHGTQHPMLRLSILKNRSSLAVYGATLVQGILARPLFLFPFLFTSIGSWTRDSLTDEFL